jgi:hypothetical protein
MAHSGSEDEYLGPEHFDNEAGYVEYLDYKHEDYLDRLFQEQFAAQQAEFWREHRLRVNLVVLKCATKAVALARRACERANAPGGAAGMAAVARNYERATQL